MRFTAIFASIFLLASSVSAQKSNSNDVDPNELLAELAQLPGCAVSESDTTTTAAFAAHCGAD
jgi:hypothetical protein